MGVDKLGLPVHGPCVARVTSVVYTAVREYATVWDMSWLLQQQINRIALEREASRSLRRGPAVGISRV